VFFDTLDGSVSDVLVKALKSLDYTKLVDFFSIRNVFRPMVLALVQELNLKVTDDTNTNCYFLAKDVAKRLEIM
jgi:hypothetical protein